MWKNKAKNEIQAVPLRRVHVCRVTNSILTFCWANILMRLRTTSIPRSFEAFSSRTASFQEAPSKIRDRQRIVVVLPTPESPPKKVYIRNRHCFQKCLCFTWGSSYNDVRHISIPSKNGQSRDGVLIADDLVECLGPILLDPWHRTGLLRRFSSIFFLWLHLHCHRVKPPTIRLKWKKDDGRRTDE